MALTTETRICTVHSPLGEDVLFLTSLAGREQVSGLFEFDCSFASEEPDIDFDAIVGRNLCIEARVDHNEPRYFNALVSSFSQLASDGSNYTYHAKLVPWLHYTTLRHDCRVFPANKNVVEIVTMVLGEMNLLDYEIQDLTQKYDPIPFCVQYRESHFAFISRMLESAGISYYFRHEPDRHIMVLFDDPKGNAECRSQPKAYYEAALGERETPGHVREWSSAQQLRTGSYCHTDYNYADPNVDLCASTTTRHPIAGNEALETYDYPGGHSALHVGHDLARLRMEAEEAAIRTVRAAGDCYGFAPGHKFELMGHFRESFNDHYLLTEVRHELTQTIGNRGTTSRYTNEFSCIPHSVPYRPLLETPRPVIQGVQTAVVVGEGEREIDLDEYGNVLVQFRWDRYHARTPDASCRIRVGSAWAGKKWGFFCAPRVGQEVIVEFLEGDPDRPIVTGVAYNAENMPPYTGGTQSGLKTRSTPGGGPDNFNELRFEDKKGAEEVFIQAEKNMTVQVKASHSKTAGGGVSTSAGGAISASSAASISRNAKEGISDTSGKDMNLVSGGSYALKTNLGIQLKAINFAADLIENGAKAAADAIVKGGVKAGIQGVAGGGKGAKNGAAGAAKGALGGLGDGFAMAGSQALASLAPAIENGRAQLDAQAEAAADAGIALDADSQGAIDAGNALEAAIATGASPETIAAAAMGVLAGLAGKLHDFQKLLEGLLPQIPSITLWAMKDVNAIALWSMTLEAAVKNIDIRAKNKDINVKAKQNIKLEAQTKDLHVKASKKNVMITGKETVQVKAEDNNLVIEAGKKKVLIKSPDQIVLRCGDAFISLAKSGNIVITGNAINIKGKDAVTVKGAPINLN